MTGHREHEGDGVLAGCDRIRFRRIHDGDALLGGFGDIDAVDADTGAADDLQILGCIDDGLGDLRLASCDDGIIVSDHPAQLFFLHIRLNVDDKFFFQDLFRFFGNVCCDENSKHSFCSLYD